jgi:hypothetical protein
MTQGNRHRDPTVLTTSAHRRSLNNKCELKGLRVVSPGHGDFSSVTAHANKQHRQGNRRPIRHEMSALRGASLCRTRHSGQ